MIKYFGGKSWLSKMMNYYMPANLSGTTEALDMFVGGGSISDYLVTKFNTVYINDIDENLINFYTVLKNTEEDALIQSFNYFRNEIENIEEIKEFRNLIKNHDDHNALYRAFMYYAMVYCAWGGKVYSTPTDDNFDKFMERFISKDILKIKYTLKKSVILSKDYRELKPYNMFVYADPPYADVGGDTYYGDNGENHKNFSHEEFREFIENVSKNNYVMISYEDSQYIRDMYKDWNLMELSDKKTVMYNAKNQQVESISTPELLILNYEIKNNDFEQMTFGEF